MIKLVLLLLSIVIIFFGFYYNKLYVKVFGALLLTSVICAYVYSRFFSKSKEGFSFAFSDDAAYTQRGKVDTYCGSDLILPDDYDVMGTRNRCLKKGVGVGMGMSQAEINKMIARIPKQGPREKLYCGDKTTLPPGYDRNGNLHECLMKGVGVGARMPEEKRREFRWKKPKGMNKHEIYNLAHRFKIPTNQSRKAVIDQITREMKDAN